MRKRTAIIVLAALALVAFLICCDGKVEMLEDGANVNLHIFPYLEFEPSEDGSSCVARVVEGARVRTVIVPAEAVVGGKVLPVGEFAGFKNPKDAVDLVRVELEGSGTGISDGAFSEATNFEGCVALTPGVWGRLPSYVNDSERHFLGWFAGGKKVEEGMEVDPDHPHAVPRWEPHKLVRRDGKEPTCAEGGWEAYDECSVCRWNDKAELPALGHQPVHVEAKAATCEEAGNIEHWRCARCGRLFTDELCRDEVSGADVALARLAHDPVHVGRIEPSHTEAGLAEHWRCRLCGRSFSDEGCLDEVRPEDLAIPRTPHEFSPGWRHDDLSHWRECVCGERADMASHDWDGGTETVAPTNERKGEATFRCRVCGHIRTEDLPPLGEGEYEELLTVPPTCLDQGYTVYRRVGTEVQWRGSYVPALGHSMPLEHLAGRPATCADEGEAERWRCPRCGRLFKDEAGNAMYAEGESFAIARTEHQWRGGWSSDEALHWRECAVCGERKDEAAHVYDQEVATNGFIKSGATCERPAVYYKSCVCGRKGTETFESGEPLGHDLEHIEAEPPTCAAAGHEEYWRCAREAFGCGHKLFSDAGGLHEIEAPAILSPVGHQPSGSYEVSAEGGRSRHRPVCLTCGESYGAWEDCDAAVDAHDAASHWKECSVCGTRMTEPAPHVWKVVGDKRFCEVCGYVAEEGMPSGGFDVSVDTGEPEGTVVAVNDGATFHFTYADKDGFEPAVWLKWYVEGELKQQGEERTFTSDDFPDPRYYVVRCEYSTARPGEDGKSNSVEVCVLGGDDAHAM